MRCLTLDDALTPAAAALRLAGQPGLAWLDGDGIGAQGRYSYVGSGPAAVHRADVFGAPFGTLDAVLQAPGDGVADGSAPGDHAALPPDHAPPLQRLPRWIGAIPYDALFGIPGGPPPPRVDAPPVYFARYDAIYAFDHATGRGWVIGEAAAADRLHGQLTRGSAGRPHGEVAALQRPSAGRHGDMLRAALSHIERGDIYQANLAHAWHGNYAGDPLWLALRMREASPVPFGAFIDMGDRQLVCRSMERFLRFTPADRRLITRPIKGTLARDGGRDLAEAAALRADPKERAEHAMIVDLLRNDLGRVAEVGSVSVDAAYAVEPYRGLSHLVSTVSCIVHPGYGLSDILTATFPPGSVTGTPKRRATEIIDRLEPVRRGHYCGALGFVDWAGGLSLSVAIRTAQVAGGQVRYHAGGGIVEASEPERELAETVLKARVFLEAIGHRGPALRA